MKFNSKIKPFKLKLREIVFGTETKAGRLFDFILLWAIIFSVIAIMADSVSELKLKYLNFFHQLEWTFTILFTIEYIIRIWVSKNSIKYILSFWGIVDLISFIPTYVSIFLIGVHYLLIIRILRLLRIFRVLKLTRYTIEAGILKAAIKASFRKIIVF